jgi:hypothetical protein
MVTVARKGLGRTSVVCPRQLPDIVGHSVDVTAVVPSQSLCWNGSALSLSPSQTRRVETRTEGRRNVAIRPGDLVALHWGRVCDRLTPEQMATLKDSTDRQLLATNRRLRAHTP